MTIQHPLFKQTGTLIGKGLGRLPALDFRDKGYLLARPKELAGVTARYWHLGTVLDQGDTPQCVAYAGEAYLLSGPVTNKQWQTPQDLYNECQKIDEWAGTPHDGTSVRALFKVLQKLGYVSQYEWAFDIHTIIDYLMRSGPLVFGTDWLTEMFAIDDRGFIRADGNVEGGHGYPIVGLNTQKKCRHDKRGALRMQNNWGKSWGQHGRAWLCFCDAEALIKASGEACTSTELKFQERKPDVVEAQPLLPPPRQNRLHL